jgi:hypothetical protein
MPRSATAQVARHLFTVDEFDRMGEARIFATQARVELIDGEIIQSRGLYRDVQRVRGDQRVAIGAFPKLSFRVSDILG